MLRVSIDRNSRLTLQDIILWASRAGYTLVRIALAGISANRRGSWRLLGFRLLPALPFLVQHRCSPLSHVFALGLGGLARLHYRSRFDRRQRLRGLIVASLPHQLAVCHFKRCIDRLLQSADGVSKISFRSNQGIPLFDNAHVAGGAGTEECSLMWKVVLFDCATLFASLSLRLTVTAQVRSHKQCPPKIRQYGQKPQPTR